MYTNGYALPDAVITDILKQRASKQLRRKLHNACWGKKYSVEKLAQLMWLIAHDMRKPRPDRPCQGIVFEERALRNTLRLAVPHELNRALRDEIESFIDLVWEKSRIIAKEGSEQALRC